MIDVTLTPEVGAMTHMRVESGRYNDASEAVQAALDLLEEREKLEHLRSLLAIRLGDEPDPDVCP